MRQATPTLEVASPDWEKSKKHVQREGKTSFNSLKKSLSTARKTKVTINQRFLCGDAYLGHPLL
jgi:hypothetical protein